MKTLTTNRRRPKLRVVGREGLPPRRLECATIHGSEYVIEMWSAEEFRNLLDWERPDPETLLSIPGFGFMTIRRPRDKEEVEDAANMGCLAREEMAPNWAQNG